MIEPESRFLKDLMHLLPLALFHLQRLPIVQSQSQVPSGPLAHPLIHFLTGDGVGGCGTSVSSVLGNCGVVCTEGL